MTLPPLYAELVCGTPGCGKTTYCEAKRQLLVASAQAQDVPADRVIVHVNLDPANDGVFPYPCAVDICDLVELKEVAATEHLGPNGAYLFCCDVIAARTDWVVAKMREAALRAVAQPQSDFSGLTKAHPNAHNRPVWFLIDCPGQVEFYVHNAGLQRLLTALQRELRCNMSVTHLCDGATATRDVPSFVSTCLLCLSVMTDIELPQVNVLTKWDRAVELRQEVRRDRGDSDDPIDADVELRDAFLDGTNFTGEHFNLMWRLDNIAARAAQSRASGAERHAGIRPSAVQDDPPTEEEPRRRPMKELARTLMEVVEGYNLVGFTPLDVNDATLMQELALRIDAALAFVPAV